MKKSLAIIILCMFIILLFYFLYFFPLERFSVVEKRPILFRYASDVPEGYVNGQILTIEYKYGPLLRSKKEFLTAEIMEFSSASFAEKLLNNSLNTLGSLWEYRGETTLEDGKAKIFQEKKSGKFFVLFQKNKKIIQVSSGEVDKAKKVIKWLI